MDSKNGGTISSLSTAARILIRLPISLFKGFIQATDAPTSSRSGILAKVVGWPPPRLDPSRETAWLDGLRGIAAFFVMAFHFNLIFIGFYLEAAYGSVLLPDKVPTFEIWRLPPVRFFFTSGHAQVSVFFVLSGLVLSWKPFAFIRSGQSERLLTSLSSAIVRRWFRLYLPCFAIGLVVLGKVRFHYDVPGGVEVYPSIFHQFWDYILACELFARPLLRERSHPNWLHRYNWVMWTIPVEFEGSLLVFALILVIARVRSYMRRFLLLSFFCLYACLLGYWAYWLFVTGMLVADYVQESGGFHQLIQRTKGPSKSLWWLSLTLGIWMAGIPNPSPKFYDRPGYVFLDNITPSAYRNQEDGARFWWSLAGVLILLSGCHLRYVQVICESPMARYLGRISYMLYLTHSDLPLMIGSVFRNWYSSIWGSKVYSKTLGKEIYEFTFVPGTILFCLSWMFCGTLAITLAHWCEVVVDKPSVAFAKWIELKLISDGSAAAPSERDPVIPGSESENAILLPVYRNSND